MSPGSQSSWGAARLRGVCARRLLLSGTPMPNPLAVYGQFRVLDPSVYGTSFVAFRSRYCVMGGYQNKQILKFINQAELSAKFYSRAYRVTRDQVLQLPEAMHEYRYCDISPWARRIYNEIRKDFVSEVIHKNLGGGEMSAKNALVKILRLSQIAGGYVKLDDGRELIQDHSKIETAVEIIEDLPPDEPVVVFCRWSNEIRRLRGQLNKIGRTNGEVSSAANDMESWKRGNLGVLVVQIQTGSEGVDFTRACYQIYLSIGHISPTIYDQSLSRVHRPGQTRKVIYYHIVAKDTIDEEIYRALKLKMDITQYVLGIIKDQHAIANHRPSSRLVTR
jgi:SNF2 family DNA or RNA helicase